MTYLWQLQRGQKDYRFQTDDKEIYQKVQRRNGFKLTCYAINRPIWIFGCEFTRPDIAKKTFQSILGQKPKIDSEGILYA